MPRALFPLLAAALLVSAGCERRHEAADRALATRVFRGVLVYPEARATSFSAGADAAQFEYVTAAPPNTVAAWYRQILALNGWDLKSDATDSSGAALIYAQHGKRPLWIRVRASDGAPGATVTLIGAEVKGDTVE